MLRKLDPWLDKLNTHATAAAGAAIFAPALTMLTQQQYAEIVVKMYFPHVNAGLVPLAGATLTGLAGWLLYQSRPHNIEGDPK